MVQSFTTQETNTPTSWVHQAPSIATTLLLGVLLVASQINPNDTVVAICNGDSLLFAAGCLVLGLLSLASSLWNGSCGFHKNRSVITQATTVLGIVGTLFCIWLWIATQATIGRQNVRIAYLGCWQWIAQWLLLLAVSVVSTKAENTKSLLALMIACCAGATGYGFFQYFVTMPQDRAKFTQDPDAFLSQVGIVPGSSEAMLYENRLMSFEPIGPFVLTNSLAGFLTAWLIVLLGIMVHRLDSHSKHVAGRGKLEIWTHSILIALWFLMLLLLVLTNSRTAWLSFGVGLVAVLLTSEYFRGRMLTAVSKHRIATVVVCLFSIMLAFWIWSKRPSIFSDAFKSLAYRFEYWFGAWILALQSPWFGDGAGNFQANYNRVKPMTAAESPADPHNFLFETLCAGGFPLLFLLGFCLALCLFIAWHQVLERTSIGSHENMAQSAKQNKTSTRWPLWAGVSIEEKCLTMGGLLALVVAVCMAFFLSGDDLLFSLLIFLLVAIAMFAMTKKYLHGMDLSRHHVIYWIACGSLLLHLVASGGWMLPGVMNSLCLLVGIAVAHKDGCELTDRNDSRIHRGQHPRWLGVVALVLMLIACVLFMQSTFLPIRRKIETIELWRNANVSSQTPEEIIARMESDRFDPDLARYTSQAAVLRLQDRAMSDSVREKWVRALIQSTQTLKDRDPSNWISISEGGKWLALAAHEMPVKSQSDNMVNVDSLIRKADEHFESAAHLYPHSIVARLQAAISNMWVGDVESASRHLAIVEEIDRNTPHLDRKIKAAIVYFPPDLESKLGPLDAAARRNLTDSMARGEPVVDWIRKHAQSR